MLLKRSAINYKYQYKKQFVMHILICISLLNLILYTNNISKKIPLTSRLFWCNLNMIIWNYLAYF